MKHHISLRQIEGFLLAADRLSFRRASEEMHITQSAFSQLIRELESQLGAQLFDRNTRRVQLTAAGEAMRLKMRRGIDAIDDACEEAQAISRVDRGHIRVGTLASLAIGIVTRTLGQLRSTFPGITVSMQEGFNDWLVELVARGETDLTVCTEIESPPGLEFEYLIDDELILVTPAHSPLARAERVHWRDLTHEPLVLTARGTSTRAHATAALAAHGIDKPVDYEVASTPTSMAMVKAGFGSAFISRVALPDLDMRGLAALRMEEPAVRRMGIYRRSDRSPSPASRKFTELLNAQADHTRRRLQQLD